MIFFLLAACERELVDEAAPANTSTSALSVEVGLEITVAGRLVNTACYAGVDDVDQAQRKACNVDKTQQGFPVAVLENGSPVPKAWILLTVPQIFADYMDLRVRVRGVVRGDGVLTPLRVELEGPDGWTFIM